MRIELSKTSVEFTPEADYEKTMLEGLWPYAGGLYALQSETGTSR